MRFFTTHRLLSSALLSFVGVLLLVGLNGCGGAAEDVALKDQAEFHYKLANNYFYDQNIVMAMRECLEALEREPNHPEAHHLLGFIYFGRKQYADAVEHFKKAVATRKDFFEARANLGAVYLAQKRWKEAIEVFEPLSLEHLYPRLDLAFVNLGWAYFNLKQHEVARGHFRTALLYNEKLCLAHNNFGLLHEAVGDAESAIRSFQRATQHCPKYMEPLFHLGRILSEVGRHAEASEAFSRCYELKPDSPMGRRCGARRL